MADPIDDEELPSSHPAFPQDNQLHPALEEFRGAFETEGGKTFADQAAIAIQQHINERNIADQNLEIANSFTQNLDEAKQNLLGMVNDDPTAAPLAMRLSQGIVASLAGTHPFLPDDQRQSIADELTKHFHEDIAKTAVQSWAERSTPMAAQALKDFSPWLTEEDSNTLRDYAGTMALGHLVDRQAETNKLDNQTEIAHSLRARGYMNDLTPEAAPDGWATKLLSDPTVRPTDKQALFTSFARLQDTGDVPTNGRVFQGLAESLAGMEQMNPAQIYSHVGQDLSLHDAQLLGNLLHIRSASDSSAGALAVTLQSARRFIAPDDTPAQLRAYDRFVQWLTPQVVSNGYNALDPSSENFLFSRVSEDGPHGAFGAFLPTGQDIVVPPPTMEGFRQSADRPSLSDIFGRSRGSNADTIYQERIPPAGPPPTRRQRGRLNG